MEVLRFHRLLHECVFCLLRCLVQGPMSHLLIKVPPIYDRHSAFPGCFMNLTDFGVLGLAFCRVSLHGGSSAIFLVMRLRWGVPGRRSTEGKSLSHPISHLPSQRVVTWVTRSQCVCQLPFSSFRTLTWVGEGLPLPPAQGHVYWHRLGFFCHKG